MENLTIPSTQGYTQPKSCQALESRLENISNYVTKLISENKWMNDEQCNKIIAILLQENQLFLSKIEHRNACYTIDGNRNFSYNKNPDFTPEVAAYISALHFKYDDIGISLDQLAQLLVASNALYGHRIIQTNLDNVLTHFITVQTNPTAKEYYNGLIRLANRLNKIDLYNLGIHHLHLSADTIEDAIKTHPDNITAATHTCLFQWHFSSAQAGILPGELSSVLIHALEAANLDSYKSFFPDDHRQTKQNGPTSANKTMDSVLLSLAGCIDDESTLRSIATSGLEVAEHITDRQLTNHRHELELAAFGVFREWNKSQTGNYDTKINLLKEALKKTGNVFLIQKLTQ